MRLAVVLLAAGCATSYQSARTLVPGKTQVTAGLTRIAGVGDDQLDDEAVYLGDVQIRTGLTERSDGGVRLQRNAGVGDNLSMLSVDPKFMLTPPESPLTISASVPLGIVWEEQGTDFNEGTIVVIPSVFFGFDLSPGVELVVSPKLFYIKPDGGDAETEFGGSVGVRIGDDSRTWAVHPEIGILNISADGDNTQFLTFGIGISAGN